MSVYQTTLKLLSDLIPVRALESTLAEAARAVGKPPEQLGVRDVEKVLKSTVYRQLQLSVPAALAKSRIQQTINALADLDGGTTPESDDGLQKQAAQLVPLEDTAKRFSLYFDWSEFQKFRSLMAVIRDEHGSGRLIGSLIKDAGVQRDALERKLAELLVSQARDLSELKADYERVRSLGGPKVRRLDTLIGQISLAQDQQTLAPAEIDRARKLASELRKLVESSVVGAAMSAASLVESGPPASVERVSSSSSEFILDLEVDDELVLDLGSLDGLTPEAGAKLLDIDLENQVRDLDALGREFDSTFAVSPELRGQFKSLKERHELRQMVTEELAELRGALRDRLERMQSEQRDALAALLARLQALEEQGVEVSEALLSAHVADGTLIAGALISGELEALAETVGTLERQAASAREARSEGAARNERLLARQRDALEEYSLSGGAGETPELLALRGELEQATASGLAAEETLRAFLEAQAQALGAQEERGVLAQLRAMRNRLAALPELPELGPRVEAASGELAEALRTAEAGGDPQNVTDLLMKVALVLSDASQAVYARLDALEQSARVLEARALAERIAGYKGAESHPDLSLLEAEVRAAGEAFELAQQRELREIEAAAQQYRGGEHFETLLESISATRLRLSGGQPVDLSELWAQLEALSSAQEDQRASLDRRAAYITEEYTRLRGLEGETIQSLGRLSSQVRNLSALGQMSPEALSGYVGTLERAEALLGEAQAEYEAARAVVSDLSAGGGLEGLLGIFDAFTESDSPLGFGGAVTKKAEAPLVLIEKVEGLLRERLVALSEDPGVDSVALVQRGELKFGRLSDKGAGALQDLEHYIGEASGEMNRKPPRLMTLEHASGAAIVLLYPAHEVQLLVNASSVTQSTRLMGVMQKTYEDYGKLL